MKKRSLFRRVLSGIVAAALTATVCFGDGIFKNLAASAADDPVVTVGFYDDGEKSPVVNEDGDTNTYRYFVLGALIKNENAQYVDPKDGKTKNRTATAEHVNFIEAWDCIELDKAEAEQTVTFNTFYKKHANYTQNYDRVQPQVAYDPSEYTFVARVYRYWVTNQWGNVTENPHTLPSYNKDASGVEPTNLISPEKPFYNYGTQIIEKSDPNIHGYVPSNETQGNVTGIRFDKQNVEYYARVNFGNTTTIAEDEYYYVVVEVEHQSHQISYFYSPLTAKNASDVTLTIQKHNVKNLKKQDNTTDQFTGNEPVTRIRLFKASKEVNLGSLLAGENCVELKTGDYAKGQTVDIKDRVVEKPDAATTVYTEVINLLSRSGSDSYTFTDILGSGVAFGITADRHVQGMHTQTNFAVNYFKDKADNADVDLSSPSAGEIYVANFANLDTPADITADTTGQVIVGNPKGMILNVNVPDVNRVKLHTPDLAETGTIVVNKVDAETITNDVVNPTIQQMQAMSNLLASKKANITPVITNSHFIVDTRDYGDDETIYVDGDAIAAANATGSAIFKFMKKENQTIVINYTKTKKVTISQFEMEVYDNKGNLVESGDSSPDGKRNSKQNTWLDQQVMRKIVWNLNSVENTDEEYVSVDTDGKVNKACVSFRQTAGIFLIPNAKTVANVEATSTGWIISAGYVSNNGGEWHFPYSGLDKYEKPKTTTVNVSKRAIVGDGELKGATLQIVDKVTGKNIGDAIWQYVISQNEGVTALTTDIGDLKDIRYGMQWTSGKTQRTITLRDGSYTLKESGTEFTSGGKTYSVVKSSVDFEIMNGKIVTAPKNVTEKNRGSIKYDADSNTIVIRDAQVGGPVVYPVHINKTDVTGEKELAGAKLTVYSVGAGGKETIVSDTNNPWVSKIGAELTLALVPGNYVLKETAATDDSGKPIDITDKDGKTYQVSVSEVAFTVGNDGKVSSTTTVASASEIDAEKGGAILNKNKDGDAVLTICDASNKTDISINKTDITGQQELIGAQLTIYEYDATKTDGKGKKVGETWTSDVNKQMNVTLEDGTYVLEETAAEGTSVHGADGKTYRVIPSTVTFTVSKGSVTSTDTVSKVADVDKTTGGAVLSGTEFTICDAANKTTVVIDKTDITGQQELIGAQLTIYKYDANAQGHKGAKVGTTWTSAKGEKMTVSLEDDKYVLEETAAEGAPVHDESGKTYKVIPSTVEFTVYNGSVSSTNAVSKVADVNKTTGGAVLTGTEFTICDAANTTKVTLNKTDINGQQELIGAQLTIYKYDASKADGKGEKVGTTWTSAKGEKMTVSLEDDKYVLEETAAEGAPVHDESGKTYQVIPSTVVFTVSNGSVSSTDAVSKVADVNKTTGGAVLTGTEFTICDAASTTNVVINKKDITGQKELIGAQLKVFEYDANAEGHKGAQVGTTWTSDVNKTMTLKLEDGTYVLEESAAKDKQGKDVAITDEDGNKYKVIPSTVEFTVSNGQVTSTAAAADVQHVDQTNGGVVISTNEMTICDALVPKYPVVINKRDVTGDEELTDATLTVYDKDGVKVADWVSKPNETMQLSLEDGTYTLTETGDDVHDDKGNIYKVIDSKITFTVSGGVVTSTGSKTAYSDVDQENGGVVIQNNNELTICDAIIPKSQVTINKVDITGETELSGAKLTVYKYDSTKPDGKGEQVNETWTSEPNKKLVLNLTDGDYILEEKGDQIVDSKGNTYKVLPADTTFTVKDGKVVSNGKDFKDLDQKVGGVVVKNNTVYVSDAYKTVKVTISKTDITGKAEVTGAKLQIYDEQDEPVFDNDWVSGTDGKQWVVSLAPGQYKLKESPDSVVSDKNGNTYQVITSEYEFKVGTNGKVTESTQVSSNEGSIFLSGDNAIKVVDALTVPDTTYVRFNKTDITGQKELANATLTIYDVSNGNLVKVDDANNPWVSKIGAELTLALTKGTYVLEETPTLDNNGKPIDIVDENGRTYKVSVSRVEFTVDENGNVECTSAKSAFSELDENGGVVKTTKNNEAVLTVCDAANTTTVKLNKTNITGDKELAGATLTIYDFDESKQGHKGTKVTAWKSVIGQQFETTLPDGKYVLEETGSKVTDDENNTYKVLTSRFEFTVSKGTVTAVTKAEDDFLNASETGYYVLKDNDITVCDVMVTKHYVHINKTDITGDKELEGATLTIYDANTDEPVADANNPWLSQVGSTLNICLKQGNYYLVETGDDIHDADNVKYNVYNSRIAFTVDANGLVSSTGAKEDFDKKSTEEYYVLKYADGDSFLTICDAMRTTKVTLNKTDITGENELIGAQLTIYKYDAEAEGHKGAKVGTWTSDVNKTATFDLPDGKYVLEETAAKDDQGKEVTVVDSQGKTYKVITSTTEFTVADGSVTSTSAVSDVKDVDKTKGGVVLTENHFTVCDAANTTKVTLNKTDITGKKELAGATLQISKNGTVINEWVSQIGKTKTFTLEDGEYTLTEKATVKDGKTIDVTDEDGKTYQVTDSVVTFTVAGGKVTKQTGAVSSRDDLGGKDGVIIDGNTFVVSDAANTTPVTLNKMNIAGDEELAGARLAIKQGNKELFFWESVIGETKTFELEDGDYTLVETGDEVVDGSGNRYKVMNTTLDFTVSNGKVTATAAKKAFNPSATKGYFVLPENSTTITVSDVLEKTKIILNKTDVTGNKELAGATLTIYDKNGKEVTHWESVIGGKFEFELEDGDYVLEETGDNVVDDEDVQYSVLNTKTAFKVQGGKVTSQTVLNDFDDQSETCYVVIKNNVEITVCDVTKTHASNSSSGGGSGQVSSEQSSSEQSMSVSIPVSSFQSEPTGQVSSNQSQQSQQSGSVSTPKQSTKQSQSASNPSSSSVKPVSSSGSKASTNGTSGTQDTNGSTTTKKTSGNQSSSVSSSTNGSTNTNNTNNTTSTGPNGNPPQTGHTGSTVTVAALLAAVAALAVLKKKND